MKIQNTDGFNSLPLPKIIDMYIGLLHLHSNLPYLLLVLLAIVLVNSLMGWLQSKPFGKRSKKLIFWAMLTAHIQWTVGAILYFVSPQVKSMSLAMGDSLSRLYALEHPLLMTIALVLITIARSKTKKSEDNKHHKTSFLFFAMALVCILLCLPPSWL